MSIASAADEVWCRGANMPEILFIKKILIILENIGTANKQDYYILFITEKESV